MAKFNVVQKRRREQISQRKRAVHGDPLTGKLKNKKQPLSVSGKRQRKLLKKWRREQKEAIEKGLVTMEDVEMAAAEGEGTSKDTSKNANKTPAKFNVKKGLKLKHLKHNGKKKGKSKPATEAAVDAMVE
ncbi:uncharacterized protein LOC8280229 isoform X2 [Ricinus communis]|uniref:uncharacterized protein LOC8280229 isoform X2 n=1 Tax=Ricinus communis TaxID=3988 RepID=UPI0007723490|nr:uncharacterized protein LOC8280229 isoform X2 [Ricinus communis]|eukprot:XP_002520023.2 uncharacterized protein LOC8280229 [Ricinus communis]